MSAGREMMSADLLKVLAFVIKAMRERRCVQIEPLGACFVVTTTGPEPKS